MGSGTQEGKKLICGRPKRLVPSVVGYHGLGL